MKKISIVFFLIFSVITLRAESFKMNNKIPQNYGLELEGIHKKCMLPDGHYWFNFGGCWFLYDVEDNHATAMNSTNYIGTTQICNEASANVC